MTGRIAIIHDWLTGMRGGEKVLEAIGDVFPEADIFTLLWNRGSVSQKIEQHRIYTSWLQKLPLVEKKYRYYLPVMPLAIESFDLSAYDIIISSSHCVAKGVRKRSDAFHICYCHTPMRYIWDQYDEYFSRDRAGFVTRALMKVVRPYLQRWDVKSSGTVDVFVANSQNVQERIRRIYGRDALVIYPPVNTAYLKKAAGRGGGCAPFYLMVTALVPYKRVDMAVRAFNASGFPLKIIGSGPEGARLRQMAKPNIEFLGWRSDEEVREFYADCKALIFPQDEDFGITAVEVQACGKPVIAFRRGGALETVSDGKTGIFFNEPTAESLIEAVRNFEKATFLRKDLENNAERFSRERFSSEIRGLANNR